MPEVETGSTVGSGSGAALQLVHEHPVFLAGNPKDIDFCRMREMLKSVVGKIRFLDTVKYEREAAVLLELADRAEFPLAWVKGCCVGGLSGVSGIVESGHLAEWMTPKDYDLIIIGDRAEFPLAWVKGCCVGGLSGVSGIVESGHLAEWMTPKDYDLIIIGDRAEFPLAWVKGCCVGGLSGVSGIVESGHLAEWMTPKDYDLIIIGDRAEFPLAWVKGCCVGGLSGVSGIVESGHLAEWMTPKDYDLIIIGGGSGGLAASKEAAGFGAKVLVLDFVVPSPLGTTWGLGGTCVNVGCIPKKLMHQASIHGKNIEDARTYGWQLPETVEHSWKNMRDSVQSYIAQLNYGYKTQLKDKKVTYMNCLGSFKGTHTVSAVNKKGVEKLVTGDRILIATGERPKYLDIPGAREYCLTSDDLFALKHCPGKTLCVGASYISLECGGFLSGIGLDVTVMVRSVLLRGFDRDMAKRIGEHMESHGTKFVYDAVPTNIEELEKGTPGRYRVTAKTNDGKTIVEG